MKNYLSGDYANLFNLVTHHSERIVGDRFHRSMCAVMMLRCLKRVGYFGDDVMKRVNTPEEEDVLSDEEVYIAELLYHFLEVMQFNAHDVAQVQLTLQLTLQA